MQRRFGDHPQCIGLSLAHGRHVLPRGVYLDLGRRPVTGSGQRPADDGAHLGGEPAADDEHAVFVLIHVKRPTAVALFRLVVLSVAIHAAPRPDQLLDVRGSPASGELQQARFCLGRGHARHGPDLGVGDLAARERRADERQLWQGARHSNAFVGCAEVHSDSPRQPLGAGLEAVAPAAAGVEVADHIQQAGGGHLNVGGQLGDLITQAGERVDLGIRHGRKRHASLLCGNSKPRIPWALRASRRRDLGRGEVSAKSAGKWLQRPVIGRTAPT